MKRIFQITLGLIILLYGCQGPAAKKVTNTVKTKDTIADKESELDKMRKKQYVRSVKDTMEILKKFFKPDTIITTHTFWKADTSKLVKVAMWKPDADAEFGMNVSEDGKCHTNIDTIMEIPGSKATKYLIVFTTLQIMNDNSLGGCHGCGANYGAAYLVFDKPSGVYGIEHFERNFAAAGNFGAPADSIALTDFGGCYALLISSGFTNSGECTGFETFYDVTNLSSVFALQDCDIYDAYDSTESTSIIKTMSFVPGKISHEYKDIKVSVENTYFSKPKKRDITEKSTKYYTWVNGKYVEKEE